MPIIHRLTSYCSTDVLLTLTAVLSAVVVFHVFAYFKDTPGLRSFPGPFLAKFTDAWMFSVVSGNRWSTTVESLHKQYGNFVRLAPNHVSISDPRALTMIYGHGSGFLKTDWYDVFSGFAVANIFTSRKRAEHQRKRRAEAHMFAPQSIRAIEPISHANVLELVHQWDFLVSRVKEVERGGPVHGEIGSTNWNVRDDRIWFDCMQWIGFWAFDTIGDLIFGMPFGMIKTGKDVAKMAKSFEKGVRTIEKLSLEPGELELETEDIPCIKTLSVSAESNAGLAWLSPPLRWLVQQVPALCARPAATKKLNGLAIMSIARRLANPSPRQDMLQKLLEAKDDNGKPLGPEELGGETFTLIIAGSDTIANTTCGTTYYLARDPRIKAKLQIELDDALAGVDSEVAPFEAIKDLPYLDAVINEGLRLHSTVGAGLPREVPQGGANILGQHLKAGTIVSVPLYNLHRDESFWGPDAAEFRPERWIEASPERKKEMLEYFAPFSVGPRACIGRGLAMMQLHIILATLFRRYDFVLQSDAPLQVRDMVVRRPLECIVGIKLRKE